MSQAFRKIIVTGSREWKESGLIYATLMDERERAFSRLQPLVVIHGDCPTGADAIACHWVDAMKCGQDLVEVQQLRYPMASYLSPTDRDEAMVRENTDAEAGYAFWNGRVRGSGTHATMTLMLKAGIPFVVIGEAMARRRAMPAIPKGVEAQAKEAEAPDR